MQPEETRALWAGQHQLEYDELTIDDMRDEFPPEVAARFVGDSGQSEYGGHQGSHAYLVHEFVDAIANNRTPAITAADAAHWLAAGVMAHKSAIKDGEWMDVPDW